MPAPHPLYTPCMHALGLRGEVRAPGLDPELDSQLKDAGVRVERLDGPLIPLLRTARPGAPLLLRWADGREALAQAWLLGRVRVDTGHGGHWLPSASLEADPPVVFGLSLEFPASPLSGLERPKDRLLALGGLERRELWAILGYAALMGILGLGTPLAIQGLIGWLALGAPVQPVLAIGLGLVALLVLYTALGLGQRVLAERLQRRIFVRMVQDLSARLPRVQVEALQATHMPALVNRFFDVLTLQKASHTLLLDGTAAVLQALAGLTLLAFYHPMLIGVTLVLLLGVWFIRLLGRGAERTAIAESKAKYKVAAWIEELGLDPTRMQLQGSSLAQAKADALLEEYLLARHHHFRIFLRQYLGMQALQILLSVGLLVTSGWLVLRGELTLGQLVAAEFIVATSLSGVGKLVEKLEQWYDTLAGVDKLGSLIDLPTTAPACPDPVPGPMSLEAQGLMVGGQQLPVHLAAGAWLAIHGDERVDLRRIAEVLVGIRKADAGRLMADGQPLVDGSLSEQALMLREGDLLVCSVRENLTLGHQCKEVEAWGALQRLGLREIIADLPGGLDSELRGGGSPLSKTQAALLLVARAYLLQPRLLVIDGLLDGLPARIQVRALRVLRELDASVILLSADPELVHSIPDNLRLYTEESHEPAH